MNRLEDRLREAFGAAADTVRPESVGGLREVPRRHTVRRFAPLASATAVAIVVVGASVLASLALSGRHAPAGRPGETPTSPAAPASPSPGSAMTVPMVVGMSATQATDTLQALGLTVQVTEQASTTVPPGVVIAQQPAAGGRVPAGTTVVLITSTSAAVPGNGAWTTVSSARYAVTFRVPGSWRPTPNLGLVVGYAGPSGWMKVQDAAGPAGLRAACTGIARSGRHPYGTQPQIIYRTIGGRPGCLILPSGDAPTVSEPPGGPALPMTSALVQYRQPVSGGYNYLLLSSDPVNLLTIVSSLQLHH